MKACRGIGVLRPVFLSAAIIFLTRASSFGVNAGDFSPQPKKMNLSGSAVRLGKNAAVDIPPAFERTYKSPVSSFKAAMASLPLEKGSPGIKAEVAAPTEADSSERRAALTRRGGYVIEVAGSVITVAGADEIGVLYGLATMEGLITKEGGAFRQGAIIDWPDHKARALHLVVRHTNKEDIKTLINKARLGRFNILIMDVSDGVRFKANAETALKGAWSAEDFMEVVSFAVENGLDVVPEVKLLTHQYWFLKNSRPELMYNKFTYDPRKEETYRFVTAMLDEIIELIRPRAVHIGHDEAAAPKGERMLPPELFLKDVERLHGYLKKKGVETWMWGDMLAAPYEFPGMNFRYLHGVEGYAQIRGKIPKDVVICDWRYSEPGLEFPSAAAFAKDGHGVLGATWTAVPTTRNFSRYMAGMPGAEGMIATTWFHVQKKEWDTVDRIMKTSSDAFWNAGADNGK
ncbi:MAG: family 20 glycosylhydrolase [Deltaproteobacteria bacterium]|nr:family 20 glycosylhydrolase [Deltaproteobacteria bacterium]